MRGLDGSLIGPDFELADIISDKLGFTFEHRLESSFLDFDYSTGQVKGGAIASVSALENVHYTGSVQ